MREAWLFPETAAAAVAVRGSEQLPSVYDKMALVLDKLEIRAYTIVSRKRSSIKRLGTERVEAIHRWTERKHHRLEMLSHRRFERASGS